MSPPLEDVLNEFAADLEDTGASYAILEKWTARYPEYARELANVAAGEAVLRHTPETSDELDEQRLRRTGLDAAQGVLERIRAARPTLLAAAAPQPVWPGLMGRAREVGLTIRQVAERTQLSVTLVGLLDRRLVRFASIPEEVLDALANTLQTQVDSIARYMQQSPSFAPSASFRAEVAPTLPQTQDFADAVRQDPTLDEDRRAALLRLTPPGSS
jgi:hypothetical protein